jgi:hypothetical protein
MNIPFTDLTIDSLKIKPTNIANSSIMRDTYFRERYKLGTLLASK